MPATGGWTALGMHRSCCPTSRSAAHRAGARSSGMRDEASKLDVRSDVERLVVIQHVFGGCSKTDIVQAEGE